MTAASNDRLSTDGAGDDGREPVVLVVDDEERVTQAFDLWLDGYDVRTATSGEAALETLDDEVDVILLDRQMPGMNGDEVLERVREGEHSPRVAMVTGVAPTFDVVDMPFDDYLEKPVGQEELRAVIERLLDRSAYDERIAELEATTRKVELLRERHTDSELADSEEFGELTDRRDRLRYEADELLADLGPEEFARLMQDL
ncbi:response regulator [Halosegnis marinus]|uniref:Response regulator n=1 Tax=Halosegnis marinus TaxID=3034023 RepID=A0ABD5ZMZ7_9EURY|nr:response regulator [Halosegnis sp. DT85]